jgi:uncharacterized protein YraI
MILVFISLMIVACSAPNTAPSALPDIVAQAVEATVGARATQAQAIDRAVQATLSARPAPTLAPTATETPAPTTSPIPIPSVTPAATSTPVANFSSKTSVSLRSGPGTAYPLVGKTAVDETYELRSQTSDALWLEVCCVDQKPAWVAASVVHVQGDLSTVQVAKSIPEPPPSPTRTSLPGAATTEGWLAYTDPSGVLKLMYPPHWKIGKAKVEGVEFNLEGPNTIEIWLFEPFRGGQIGDQVHKDFFSKLVEGLRADWLDIEIVSAGVFRNRADSVITVETVESTGFRLGMCYLFMPLNDSYSVTAQFIAVKEDGYKMPTEELDNLERVFDSVTTE